MTDTDTTSITDCYGPVAGQPDEFNAAYYLHANPDVAKVGMDPLAHYETYGKKEGRPPYEGGPGTPNAAVIAAIAAAGGVTPTPPAAPAAPATSSVKARLASAVATLPDDAGAGLLIYLGDGGKVMMASVGAPAPVALQMLGIATKWLGLSLVPPDAGSASS